MHPRLFSVDATADGLGFIRIKLIRSRSGLIIVAPWFAWLACFIVGLIVQAVPAFAQNNNNNNNQNNNNNAGGILIDAKGVLSTSPRINREKSFSLVKAQAAAKKNLPVDLNQESELRLVSLPSLEAECQRLLDARHPLPDEIRFLAGLQSIQYVFVDPDSHDLVIAGPADGFVPNALDVMVGVHNQRPAIQLDDLLAALRTDDDSIGCSIDPDKTRLARVNGFLQTAGDVPSVAAAKARYKTLATMLGLQNIRVWGVEPDSHFARVMIEADYRMKRISVGHENPRIKGLTSYLDTKGAGTNTMRRWWFAPLYEPLERSEDGTVWRLNGQRVQVMSQDELVDDEGARRAAHAGKTSTVTFARQFTEKYPQLAKQTGIFAELENLFDLAVVIALIRQENMARQANWSMSLFLDSEKLPTQKYPLPKRAPSISNSRQFGRTVVVGVVGGGVELNGRRVLRTVDTRTTVRMASLRKLLRRPADEPALKRWWWDTTNPAEAPVAGRPPTSVSE